MRTSLDDDMVEAALGDLDQPEVEAALGRPTVLALRLADVLTGPVPRVDEALYAELSETFDEGQILELGASLAVASGWQRFIEAFGIRPDRPGELRDLS